MPIADRLTKARTRVRTSWSITWRSPAKVADPVLPASHKVVTPLAWQKWSVWPPMSCALTKMWAWMSISPGVTRSPFALIVRCAWLAASDGSTATTVPPLIPTSSMPRSPAPGSTTSPCWIKRSYFMGPPYGSDAPHPCPLPASGERESRGCRLRTIGQIFTVPLPLRPSPRRRGEGQGEGPAWPSGPAGDVVVALRRGGGLGEIILGEAVEAGATGEDLAGRLAVDARVGQHPVRHLGEARIEMREVARHADVVGAAQQLDDRADLLLAALDRREAVALPVFERRQLQIGRIGILVLAQIPFDAPEEARHPPALGFEEGDLEPRIEFEDATEHQRNEGQLHLGRVAGDMAHKAVFAKARLDRRVIRPGALMEAERHAQILQHGVERVPIIGMPIAAVDVVGPHKGADRAVILDAAL